VLEVRGHFLYPLLGVDHLHTLGVRVVVDGEGTGDCLCKLKSLVFGICKALGQVIDWLISGDGVLLFSSLKCIEGPNFRFFIVTTKAVLQARRSSDDHKSSLATTK